MEGFGGDGREEDDRASENGGLVGVDEAEADGENEEERERDADQGPGNNAQYCSS